MSNPVPTREQCAHAAARLPLQRPLTRGSTTRCTRYLFQLVPPLVAWTSRGRTTGTTDPLTAGALLIAAGESIRDMNAALMRASVILEDFTPLPDAPSFSAVVVERALLLLRNGWRRRADDEQREAAEHNAAVDAEQPVIVYENVSAGDAAWADENNAAWA